MASDEEGMGRGGTRATELSAEVGEVLLVNQESNVLDRGLGVLLHLLDEAVEHRRRNVLAVLHTSGNRVEVQCLARPQQLFPFSHISGPLQPPCRKARPQPPKKPRCELPPATERETAYAGRFCQSAQHFAVAGSGAAPDRDGFSDHDRR